MIPDTNPAHPTVTSQKGLEKGIREIAICCFLLFAVWFYNFHIRHDPQFAVMYTPPLLIGLGFAVLETFFPSAYAPRLLEGSTQLKRLKEWRLAFFLSAGLFLVAPFVLEVALKLCSRPAYLCVCLGLTFTAYIKARTSSDS